MNNQETLLPIKARLFFTKEGRAKYISHLDMNRCMTRALKRSGLPVWYTEGFNPHMYLTFPLPISLGYESLYETVDLKLTAPVDWGELCAKVNACLPEGIRVFRAAPLGMDQKEIAWADYDIRLRCQEGEEDPLCTRLTQYLSASEIKVLKKTKKGEREVDLKPLVQLLGISPGEGWVETRMRFATGLSININPSLLLDDFFGEAAYTAKVRRLAVYNQNLEEFA